MESPNYTILITDNDVLDSWMSGGRFFFIWTLKQTLGVVLGRLCTLTWREYLMGDSRGVYPFAKNHRMGERFTRSVVCTSSVSELPCGLAESSV